MGILSIMLKRLMANIKKGKAGPPTIDEMMLPVEGSSINSPPPPLMPQTSIPQREMYAVGGLASRLARKLLKKHGKDPEVKKLQKEIKENDALTDKWLESKKNNEGVMEFYDDADDFRTYQETQLDEITLNAELEERLIELEGIDRRYLEGGEEAYTYERSLLDETVKPSNDEPFSTGGRVGKQEGGELDAQMADMMPTEKMPTHTMPDGTVMPGATHEETQLPDEEMEEDHVEFIIAEALEPEEQQYLTDILVEDDQLSIIVDKIVETAAEFSGSGSVDGPGTGISDSIPARLSDGEFVMTAKATDAIGSDTLQELMDLAEQEAPPDRQAIAIGGEAKSERENVSSSIIEDDPIELKNKEAMRSLDPRLSLFAS